MDRLVAHKLLAQATALDPRPTLELDSFLLPEGHAILENELDLIRARSEDAGAQEFGKEIGNASGWIWNIRFARSFQNTSKHVFSAHGIWKVLDIDSHGAGWPYF